MAVLVSRGLQGSGENKTETCLPARPAARVPLGSGPAECRVRVSAPPWQVAFASEFAGQGRLRAVAKGL